MNNFEATFRSQTFNVLIDTFPMINQKVLNPFVILIFQNLVLFLTLIRMRKGQKIHLPVCSLQPLHT